VPVNKVRGRGSYAPLSAHYYKDDAIVEAGEEAELLYVRALAFCADVLSDGEVTERQVVRFVGAGMPDALDRAKTLVSVGLWEETDRGFRIVSWLEWNRSRAEIRRLQEVDSARKSGGKRPGPDDGPPPSGRGADSDRNPDGLHSDSDRNPDGAAAESEHQSQRQSQSHNTTEQELPDDAAAPSSSTAPAATVERDPVIEDLCNLLVAKIVENGYRPVPNITDAWRRDMRLLVERDGRPPDKVRRMIDWVSQDEFWSPNVKSPRKLRAQWDRLAAKANAEHARRGGLAAVRPDGTTGPTYNGVRPSGRIPTTTQRVADTLALKELFPE
jgi:hypothetical protein